MMMMVVYKNDFHSIIYFISTCEPFSGPFSLLASRPALSPTHTHIHIRFEKVECTLTRARGRFLRLTTVIRSSFSAHDQVKGTSQEKD